MTDWQKIFVACDKELVSRMYFFLNLQKSTKIEKWQWIQIREEIKLANKYIKKFNFTSNQENASWNVTKRLFLIEQNSK